MKKTLALLIALLLLLTACGRDTAPQQGTQPQQGAEEQQKAESQQETEASVKTEQETTAADELYVEELEIEGVKFTYYHKGDKDGVIVRAVYVLPDGDQIEHTFDNAGNHLSEIQTGADGTVTEFYFYPGGGTQKYIVRYPDGSYDETHYADDGHIDPVTEYFIEGTTIYRAHVSADGQVEEFIPGTEP